MSNKILITFICVVSGLSQVLAQPGSFRERQANEYKRLSEATHRAYTVPASNYSPPVYKSSSGPYSQTASTSNNSNSSYRSSTSSSTTSNYSPYAESFQRKQAAYAAKLDAQESAWNSKVAKVRSFVASSGIVPNTPEKHQRLFFAAYGAGLDVNAINSVIMRNAEYYNSSVARANGMNENYTGSTKKLCAGDCIETVKYVNGSGTYTGNTKNGAPHGYGTLVFPTGETHTGQFYEGQVAGGKVKLTFPATANSPEQVYEGGYSNNNLNGYGVYRRNKNSTDEAEFKDGKIHGAGTLTREHYVHKGVWADDKMIGKHTWYYRSGRIVEKNMDDPNSQPIVIAEGDNLAPPTGVKAYTMENGTIYEGEAITYGLPFKGKYTFTNGSTSEGLHDKSGYLIKGKLSFPGGNYFDGEFKGRQRYRGHAVYQYGEFTGEYEPSGVNFKVGRDVSKTGVISNMFFGPLNTNLGYRHTRHPDGRIIEEIYKDDKTATAIVYRRTSGDIFTGMVKGKEGYQLFGVNKDTDGKATPSGLTTEGVWVEVATEDQLQAKIASIQGKLLIQQGRDAYKEAMKWNPSIVLE